MGSGIMPKTKQGIRGEHGAVAVEFAIVLPVLLLLVFGIIDFGHAYYMKQVLQNSCREGARYATRYQTDNSGNRILPSALTPSIQDYILNTSADNGGSGTGLNSLLPSDAAAQVTPSGAAYTETNTTNLPLEDLKVTVTAKKYWFILNKLVPGITSNYVQISVAATMKCE
jgi:Flp pilus assembly protein TadG